MEKLVEIKYNQTGQSKNANSYGMREMQARAFENESHNICWLKLRQLL